MRISKIVLKNYKRLFLNSINELIYTPKQSVQFILGRNGSGKSSVLRHLNPLPANLKQEFNEDGYKYIEIEHNDRLFTLSSGYIGSNKHSFKVNDKELNDGGTRKVQLELIKDHFGITPEIMEILLNNTRLTNMSIVDRKKWLSELSTIDYTFSIGIYNKLKSRHRDILGGIKLIQENIIGYENNLIKEEQLNKLKEDKHILEEYYKHVVSLYEHNKESNINVFNKLTETNKALKDLLKENVSGNIDELKAEKEKLLAEFNSKKEFILKTTELISKLEKIPEIKDIQILKNKHDDIENELKDLYSKKSLDLDVSQYETYYKIYSNIHLTIIEILNKLLVYEDVRLMKQEEQDKVIELDLKLTNNFNVLNKKLDLIKTELEHLDKHKTKEHLIECPECKHKWYNGYNQGVYDNLLKQRKEIEDKIDAYTKIFEKNKITLDKINIKNELLNSLKDILKSNMELSPIWNIVLNKVDFNNSTVYEIMSIFNIINSELYNLKNISNLIKEKDKIESILKNYEDSKKLELRDKELQIKELTEILDKTTKEKNEIYTNLGILIKKINVLENLYKYHNETKHILKEGYKSLKVEEINIRNQFLTELSNFIKEEIVKIEQTMNQQLQNNIKLEKDKKSLEGYKLQERVLNCMVKELSPTEGLIALSINSFLNVFVQEMNDVLDKIWSYPLELLPCEANEENDLDYKFKVKINNDEVIEDVSKLSSSGKEIIDLAFRIVFAKYMHLHEIPLYLDEFGSSFDKKNMSNAYYVIETLANIDYPQVFIISHFEHVYGSIKNADFNILDSNNIGMETLENKTSCLTIK